MSRGLGRIERLILDEIERARLHVERGVVSLSEARQLMKQRDTGSGHVAA
jgi:hypothetical protein